jgi:hypothetical protein
MTTCRLGFLTIIALTLFAPRAGAQNAKPIAYRRGEGRIHAMSSSTSLLFALPRVGRAAPYLAAGAGLSQFGAPVFSRAGYPIATQSRMAVTVNAGGGLKAKMDDKLDLRTDARWFKSFGRYGSEHFRVAQGIAFDVGRR